MSECATVSASAGESLGGTGMVAERWLCVESRAAWGHDAVAEGGFAPELSAWLAEVDASVLSIRRPSRRTGPTVVFSATSREGGGELRVLEVADPQELIGSDPWSEGKVSPTTLFLVCAHGRRDPCCARLGVPIFAALDRLTEPVWQCSHTGGHRFAPNVVALPWGVTLGRVRLDEVVELSSLLSDGRVPLERYRGRSVYPAHVQAAEVAARLARGIDRLDDLQLVGESGGIATFATAAGDEIAMRVESREGHVLAKSCGKDVEQLFTFHTEEVP
jgi:hypothetical protein